MRPPRNGSGPGPGMRDAVDKAVRERGSGVKDLKEGYRGAKSPAGRGLQRIGILALGGLPLGVFAGAWLWHRWDRLFDGWGYFCGALGNLFALLGLSLAVVMVCLGARPRWIERRFGLDRMLRLHQVMGPVVVGFLMVHAFLRTLKVSLVSEEVWRWDFLTTLSYQNWTETALSGARIALALVIGTSALAKLGRYFLPFHLWKIPHLLLYAAVALGFSHSIIVGDDMLHFPYVLVWAGLLLFFLWTATQRFRYIGSRRQLFSGVLVNSTPETHDTKTLRVAPKAGSALIEERLPGQFAVIRYKRIHGYSQPRPFTISAPPASNDLTFTIKQTGRFTRKLHKLREGSSILCEGPYGVFVPDLERERNLVLIAGGVGITPFLSIIRHIQLQKLEIRTTLIWANKARKDCIAGEELAGMATQGLFKLVHVFSREAPGKEAPGQGPVYTETGHIDRGILKKYIEPPGASYYLCGPPAMQDFVLRELKAGLGVQPKQVKRELFFW